MARNGRCELCQKNPSIETFMRVDLCPSCHKTATAAWSGDLESINKVLSPVQFPNPSDSARNLLIEGVRIRSKKYEAQRAEQERKNRMEAAERERQQAQWRRQEEARQRAEADLFTKRKAVNDLFEYDVVVIANKPDGTVDSYSIRSAITEHAKLGWRLHTMYSNEVGKNSSSYMGSGTNATICQDVLIFERRIETHQA